LPSTPERSIRDHVVYDWQHYLPPVERKPGALSNGAPFAQFPDALQRLRQALLPHAGGDKVRARVLMTVPTHGLDAVLVPLELVLESGRSSAEHVLNVIARLTDAPHSASPSRGTTLVQPNSQLFVVGSHSATTKRVGSEQDGCRSRLH
jgi:hypothetical protein